MYLPSHFADERPEHLDAFLAAHPLAQLVTLTRSGLAATPLPLLHERPVGRSTGDWGSLVGHVARANPMWRDTDAQVPALAIFSGHDAYVSPSWYPSKKAHGKVVPTWNYECVHITGDLVVHDDAGWTRDLVTRLTDRHEAGRDHPWSVSDAPEGYLETMVRAVVGVEVRIRTVQVKRKLSQNRTGDDVTGVVDGLRGGGQQFGDRAAVADAMERLNH